MVVSRQKGRVDGDGEARTELSDGLAWTGQDIIIIIIDIIIITININIIIVIHHHNPHYVTVRLLPHHHYH